MGLRSRSAKRSFALVFWAGPLLLSLIAGTIVLDFGFVLDDRAAIIRNPIVTEGLPIKEAFFRDFVGTPLSSSERVLVWRPLLPLIWKYLWHWSDGSPYPFRLLTAFLHFTATLSVLWIGRGLIPDRRVVGVAGALFAIHPIHAEVLGSIVSQADMLSMILGMLSIRLVLSPCGPSKSLLVAVLLTLACLAKETAVIFSALIVVIPWVINDWKVRERLVTSLPALVLTIAVISLQASIERGGGNPINNLAYCATGGERTLHGLYIMGRSIFMCFIPVKLSPTHDYAAVDLSLPTLLPYAVFAIVLLVIACAFFFRAVETRNILWIIGIALLIGPAFIQSSLTVCVNTEIAERLLYVSSIASSAIMATSLFRFIKRRSYHLFVLSFVLSAFFLQSLRVEMKWESNLKLFEYAVHVEPLSWRAHNNYAASLLTEGRHKEATWHFMVAAYILSRRPKAVDPVPIERLGGLPLDQRLIEGPVYFNPADPKEFVEFFYGHLIGLFRFPNAINVLAPYYRERYGLE